MAILEQHEDVKCFKIGMLILVPHFSKPHVYVGPGYPRFTKREYTSKELTDMGVQRHVEHLWSRPTKPAGK